jgi:hypothetical protein
MLPRIILAGGMAWAAWADGVVDRIAAIVGKQVITASEVVRDVRLTELANREPLDLSPEKREEAANRLVDQELIRTEMEIGNYPKPSRSETDSVLRQFRQERFSSIPEFQAALVRYGVTEEDLRQHLEWQLAAMRFADQRFGGAPAPIPNAGNAQSADRAGNAGVDDPLEAWLKMQRANTRVQFMKGAFQP